MKDENAPGASHPGGGTRRTMQLKEMVHQMADSIWEHEQRTKQRTEDAVLTYVRDAVSAELEYRRRVTDLDRRLVELESPARGLGAPERTPI